LIAALLLLASPSVPAATAGNGNVEQASFHADCLAAYHLAGKLGAGKPGLDFSGRKDASAASFAEAADAAGLNEESRKAVLEESLAGILEASGKGGGKLPEVLAARLVACDEVQASASSPGMGGGGVTSEIVEGFAGTMDVRTTWPNGLVSVIAVPRGWQVSASSPDAPADSVTLAPADARKMKVLLTVLPAQRGTFTADSVGEALKTATRMQVAASTEKQCSVKPIHSGSGMGGYCTLTDAALVGAKSLPAGEWLKNTQLLFYAPRGRAVITILSNDTTSTEYRHFLELVSTRFKFERSQRQQ
jgi:hypothetical protein